MDITENIRQGSLIAPVVESLLDGQDFTNDFISSQDADGDTIVETAQ